MCGTQSKYQIKLLGVILLLTACQSNDKQMNDSTPYYNSPDFTPIWVNSQAEVAQKITHTISSFSFLDQNNQIITQASVKEKIHVANFFFSSCPTICPKMTAQMKKVQTTFLNNPDVAILSYSVTPWIDTVERLHKYAQSNGIVAGKWHLLTGSKSEIYQLARQSYFAEEQLGFTKDSTEFLHTEHFVLVDKSGKIRGVYKGTLDLEIEQLIADINNLLGNH